MRVPAPPPTSHAPAPAPAAHRDQLDPREAARRLARVMVSSIEGGDRNDEGDGLAAAIAEARELFQSCVLPELAYMFEEALAQRGLLAPKASPPPPAPPPPPVRLAPPAPPVRAAPPPRPEPAPWAESTGAVEPVTSGDATDRVMIEDLAPPDEPITPIRFASPEDDLPTRARPPLPQPEPFRTYAEPEPVRAPPAKASNMRLVVLAAAITATSIGVAYYLMMAR
jgi:hypothetical protein